MIDRAPKPNQTIQTWIGNLQTQAAARTERSTEANPQAAIQTITDVAKTSGCKAILPKSGTYNYLTDNGHHQKMGQYQEIVVTVPVDDQDIVLYTYALAEGTHTYKDFDPNRVNSITPKQVIANITAALEDRLQSTKNLDIPKKVTGPLYCQNTGRKLDTGETPPPAINYARFSQVTGRPINSLSTGPDIILNPNLSGVFLSVSRDEAQLMTQQGWQTKLVAKG
ncbi:hypothetical protein DRH14_01505 [Candidatus Shapirobacteria bacterium]|nr:MAG: hypothetical protein DRH14_01505 [Candidatus Shapirobacteria bacterium]